MSDVHNEREVGDTTIFISPFTQRCVPEGEHGYQPVTLAHITCTGVSPRLNTHG